MNWIYYLLEANIYLTIFYGFYRLFLHKETFYSLNRYYLISATLFAFALPFLQVNYLNQLFHKQKNEVLTQVTISENVQKSISPDQIIGAFYLLIVAILIVRFIISISKIILLFVKGQKQKTGNIVYIALGNGDTAFSFFNLLFINPGIQEKETILRHEMVHINQHHSFDIVFFQIIRIINWFNPISLFINKDIKLLHEYIADEVTTSTYIEKHEYAMFLIQNSFGIVSNQLTNQIFNQSILKKRINMLNKEKSTDKKRLRLLFTLPLVGGMICVSSMAFTKDYAVDLYPEKQTAIKNLIQDTTKRVKVIKLSPPPPPVEPKSSKAKKTIKRYPPPVVKRDFIKFPPPIVKPDAKQAPTPPAAKKADVVIIGKPTNNPTKTEKYDVVITGTPVQTAKEEVIIMGKPKNNSFQATKDGEKVIVIKAKARPKNEPIIIEELTPVKKSE